ncbi:type II secretion system F family protein [Candidatus Peregrinibacteria bacterium]|jgi:type IV pilus assembly protein PilC|nr:type II secretion system F family protein [Candidatus Peregrinibacteria bacterium]MBT4632214.1 type II secretion system F family protein [Candidatus Peregrinibacteria bacterium]MBT5516311.1 type II secretion system F family protein [Candidatus Peregrinibacteria bacterium]MBT5824375.1 type II secretion system F family protein [Candidatus Peregrinibacteria bacterium]
MKFNYLALDSDKKVKKGTIVAKSDKDALVQLEAKSLEVMTLKKAKFGGSGKQIAFGHLSRMDLLMFVKQLSIMLKAGISIFEALAMLKDQAKGKLQNLITKVLDDVSAGTSLADALAKYPKDFPDLIVQLIASGELSGTLEDNLEYISVFVHKDIDLRKKVRGAMMYPVIVFVAVLGLTMSIGLFVLPQILPLFESLNVKLPWSTKLLLWTANLFRAYGILIIAGMIFGGIFTPIFLELPFMRPITHRIYVRMPVFGVIVRQLYLARFFRVFATLMDAGISIDKSLQIAHNIIYNVAYKKEIKYMQRSVLQGEPISEAAKNNMFLFPTMVTHMMRVGERSGKLSNSLSYVGTYYESEVDDKLKNISTLLEPVLLVFIGLVVGGVALSIIGPIYSLSGGIS